MLHPCWLAGGAGAQGTQPLWADRPGGQAKPWQVLVNIHGPNQAGGERSKQRGIIGRKHWMGSICDTCTLSVRHAFGMSPIGFTSSKGKFTSKSNEYYQDKNVLLPISRFQKVQWVQQKNLDRLYNQVVVRSLFGWSSQRWL